LFCCDFFLHRYYLYGTSRPLGPSNPRFVCTLPRSLRFFYLHIHTGNPSCSSVRTFPDIVLSLSKSMHPLLKATPAVPFSIRKARGRNDLIERQFGSCRVATLPDRNTGDDRYSPTHYDNTLVSRQDLTAMVGLVLSCAL
jgi:hypothetical protein